MKILFVMQGEISVGGVESVCMDLWREFKAAGNTVDFVCHGNKVGTKEKEIIEKDSKVFHIPSKGENLLETKKQFKKIVQKGKYDVVHAHMNATSGIYLKIAKSCGVKVLVAHSHASAMNAVKMNCVKALINHCLKRSTIKYSNVKIACSDAAGQWLFGKQKFNIVLNAIDVDKYIFDKKTRNEVRRSLEVKDELVVIHIGSFLKCKNHRYLVKVFNRVVEQCPDAILLLIGDGPNKRKVQQIVSKLNIKNNVNFLGVRNDVDKLLQASDIFLLPSFTEGNPVSLSEAATSGLPCIVSDRIPHDVESVFEDGNIIFLPISNQSQEIWAKKIANRFQRIVYTKEQLSAISVQRMAEDILMLYKEA